jgi:hypothetical protein
VLNCSLLRNLSSSLLLLWFWSDGFKNNNLIVVGTSNVRPCWLFELSSLTVLKGATIFPLLDLVVTLLDEFAWESKFFLLLGVALRRSGEFDDDLAALLNIAPISSDALAADCRLDLLGSAMVLSLKG